MEAAKTGTETVLVTGGSGFLGSWCLVELLRAAIRFAPRCVTRRESRRSGRCSNRRSRPAIACRCTSPTSRTMPGGRAPSMAATTSFTWPRRFPPQQPDDADELIVPAREGTLRVLRTALEAGVKRVVVTSSAVAVANSGKPPSAGEAYTEEDWSDPANPDLTPYGRSKTIAERSAWDWVNERNETSRLTVVNPSAILGPTLSDDRSYSLQAIERLLGGMPGIPRLGFSFVDVRDVADLHLRAMTAPEAAGERFLGAGPFLWMSDVAEMLRDRLRALGGQGADSQGAQLRGAGDGQVRSQPAHGGRRSREAASDVLREGEDQARLVAAADRGDGHRHRGEPDAGRARSSLRRAPLSRARAAGRALPTRGTSARPARRGTP